MPTVFLYNLVTKTTYFNVSEVLVQGATNFVYAEDVKTLTAEQVLTKNIVLLDLLSVQKTLSENFLGAKTLTVHKQYPHTIVVTVVERTPLAIVSNKGADEHYLVDEDGYILGLVDPTKTNLPQVTYTGELQVGMFIDKALVPLYLEFLSTIDEQELKASSVSVANHEIVFYLDNNIFAQLGRDKDIRKSILIISEVLKQPIPEKKTIKRIDLRFDKVIVEYD